MVQLDIITSTLELTKKGDWKSTPTTHKHPFRLTPLQAGAFSQKHNITKLDADYQKGKGTEKYEQVLMRMLAFGIHNGYVKYASTMKGFEHPTEDELFEQIIDSDNQQELIEKLVQILDPATTAGNS